VIAKRRLRLNGLQYRQTTRHAIEEALRETRQAKMRTADSPFGYFPSVVPQDML
jgi:hypothetical protein